MGLTLAIGWISGVLLWPICAGNSMAADTPSNPAATSQEKLDRAFAVLQQADDQLPATGYDPVAVVKAVEGRPDELFAWVRDNTRWVPYRGALRGAKGVLIDRLGNSLDRSLLLAEFYRHTPVAVRLAHAKLSEDQARALLEKLRSAARPEPVAFTASNGTGPATIAAAQQLERIGENVTQRASAESKTLIASLGAAHAPAVADADALACLADHWWVQRQDGANWIDLDVTLPGAKPGDSVAPAVETMTEDKLPSDLWHTVRITIVAERWADGKLTESRPLSRSIRPGVVIGGTVYLTHLPLDWPPNPQASASDAAKRAMTQALTPTEWVPVLKLGIETASDGGILPDGSLDPKPKLDATARVGSGIAKSAGGAASAFDSAFGDAPKPAAPPPGVFTAEWIEFTLHAPGAADQVIRREVFDLIGPAARASGVSSRPAPADLDRANAALALHGRVDIIALPCQPSPTFVAHELLSSLLTSKEAIKKSLAAMQTPGGADAEFDAPPPCPAPLYGLSLLRRLYSASAADWYIARTNVFACHSFDHLTADGRETYCEATDLVSNDIAIEPWSKVDPMKVRLEHGVLDTAAEGAFLPSGGNSTSASDTLSAAATQSLEWVVVRTAADIDRLKLRADDLARIKAAVAAGQTVVVPSAVVKLGNHEAVAWWSIDPATGCAIGIGDRGWGVTMTDYAAMVQRFVMAHKRFVCLGAAVTTIANTISPLFHLGELQGDALSAIQTALDAACAGA